MAQKRRTTTPKSTEGTQTSRKRQGNGGNGDGAKMTSPRDLFEHELKDIYTGETLLLDALEELESESTDPELAKAFAKHREETGGHIERLDEIAEILGMDIETERCPGIEGLIAEKELFAKEKPSAEILNIFNIGAGQKSERYEITHYEGLIGLAKKLGYSEVASRLQDNLADEEAALETLKNIESRMEIPTAAEDGDADDMDDDEE